MLSLLGLEILVDLLGSFIILYLPFESWLVGKSLWDNVIERLKGESRATLLEDYYLSVFNKAKLLKMVNCTLRTSILGRVHRVVSDIISEAGLLCSRGAGFFPFFPLY